MYNFVRQNIIVFIHYNLLHLYVWILTWQSQPCWSQTFLPARIKILLWYRGNIVERWQTRWHIIVSARYPDRRTDGQTYVTRSLVLIVKLAVNIRPSQHNFGIPKQISKVWDFILYFYVFCWLVNQQHITSGITKRLVLNSFENLDVRTKDLWAMEFMFLRTTGFLRFQLGKEWIWVHFIYFCVTTENCWFWPMSIFTNAHV